MNKLIEAFPQHIQKGMAIAKSVELQLPTEEIRHVVVAGMGGSGIGGDLVASFVAEVLKVPMQSIKSYDLPNFVNEHTLFIASSFSGNTEETLTTLQEATKRKAKIFAITSGGKLLGLAKEHSWDYAQIPNEAPHPRAFLGYSFVQLLYALKGYKLIDDFFEIELEKVVAFLENNQASIQRKAQSLAQEIFNKNLVVYADTRLLPTVTRFQQQINENAKQLCHINLIPEMNHNELVGWGLDKEFYKNTIVFLVKTSFDHSRVVRRMEITQSILAKKAHNIIELEAKGESFMTESLHLIHLFDWVSYYLSQINKVDVFDIDEIKLLKSELAKV